MKTMRRIINTMQFILALFLIFAIGQWVIQGMNFLFNNKITTLNLLIYSFLGFLFLTLIERPFRKKD